MGVMKMLMAALVALVSVLGATSAMALNIAAGSTTAQVGSTITIPITMTAAVGETPGGLQYRITFDPAVLSFATTGYADGPATTAAGKGGTSSLVGGNQINVVIIGFNTNVIANGVVSNLTFSVLATAAAPLSTPLTLANLTATTPGAQTITPVTGTNGAVNVTLGPETYIGPENDLIAAANGTVTLNMMLRVDPTINVGAVNFQLHFQGTDLTYGSATPGPAAIAASKGLTATLSAPGVVSVVIFGVNTNRIDGGLLGSFTFTVPSAWSTGGSGSVTVQQLTASTPSAASVPNLVTDSCIISVPRSAIIVGATGPARLGQNLLVPINLQTLSGFATAGCQVDVEFDPAVFTYVSAATGSVATAAGKNASAALQPSGNVVRLIVVGVNTNAIADGTIATLTFAVKTTAPLGLTNIYLDNYSATDQAAQQMPHKATISGIVTVTAFEPQDVNQDNAIDVVDVQLTVNLILNTATPSYAGQGDANGDSALDVIDVQNIVNKILAP